MANITPDELRGYLTNAYSDEEIAAFCSDYFRDVYNEFAASMPKGQKLQLLLDYCRRREIVPNLFAALHRDRPEQFQKHFGQVVTEASKGAAAQVRDVRQVFISHAHEDADFAHRLASDLRNRGWCVWIAPGSIRPGEKWGEAISRALEECGVFILVLTRQAVRSRWVMTETDLAIELEHKGALRFVPIKAESCQPPLLWTAYQHISFIGGYERGLSDLLRELNQTSPLPEPPQKRPCPVLLRRRLMIVGATLALLAVIIIVTVLKNPCIFSPTKVSGEDEMSLLCVPAGDFSMGPADSDPQHEPQHKVTLDAYWIDETEVTNAMFARFVQVTGYRTEAEKTGRADRFNVTAKDWEKGAAGADWQHPLWPTSNLTGLDKHPVVDVSWNDAKAYCEWAGRRLPTEAEWEKAARGTDGRKFPWGDGPVTGDRLNSADRNLDAIWADKSLNDGYPFTAPVGSYPAGISPYGVLDMAGNVWEWVADSYDVTYYANSPARNPPGPAAGEYRVMRGGSWSNAQAQGVFSVTNRRGDPPAHTSSDIGFRCALSP